MSSVKINLQKVKYIYPESLADAEQLESVLSDLYPEQKKLSQAICELLKYGYVARLTSILASHSGHLSLSESDALNRDFRDLSDCKSEVVEAALLCWVGVLNVEKVPASLRVDLAAIKAHEASLLQDVSRLNSALSEAFPRDTQGRAAVCALLRNGNVEQLSHLAWQNDGHLTSEYLSDLSEQLQDKFDLDYESILHALHCWCRALDIDVKDLAPLDLQPTPGSQVLLPPIEERPSLVPSWYLILALVLALSIFVRDFRKKYIPAPVATTVASKVVVDDYYLRNLPSPEEGASTKASKAKVAVPKGFSLTKLRNRIVIDMPHQVKLVLLSCKPGSFVMGSPEGELGRVGNEKPHQVTISKGFYLGQYEVTQEQFQEVTGRNPSWFLAPRRPMEMVNEEDIKKFSDQLNKALIKELPGFKFSLPTEAQWEYACRAGSQGALYSGQELTSDDGLCPNLSKLALYDGNSGARSHLVGGKLPNAWGFYDMYGNVAELCRGGCPNELSSQDEDPLRLSWHEYRIIIRGGSWKDNAGTCRSARRGEGFDSFSKDNLGFRLAAVPIK